MTDEDKINAITGALVGTVVPQEPAISVSKGNIFLVMKGVVPAGINPFVDDYELQTFNLPIHMDGWLTGVVYVDDDPVALRIEPFQP